MIKQNKRGVSGVIVTVLMIVLVIGIVAIVAGVIVKMVRDNLAEVPGATDCFDTVLEITNVDTDGVTVRRASGNAVIEEIKIYVERSLVKTESIPVDNLLEVGESIPITYGPTVSVIEDDSVSVSAVMGGRICDQIDVAQAEIAPTLPMYT